MTDNFFKQMEEEIEQNEVERARLYKEESESKKYNVYTKQT